MPIIHGGLKSRKHRDRHIVDFSSNIAPNGMPSSIKTALKKNLVEIEQYPDSYSRKLHSSLQKYLRVPKHNIIVGNGAIEIIYNFCYAFLSKNTKVLIPVPTFQEYENASKLNDSKISYFKTMNLSNDVDSFLSSIPKNGCIFICNPNNPTGKLLSKTQLLTIVESAKKLSSIVFVDECFIELVPDVNESIISYVKKYDNLFVLRSLTKSYGLPGLRVGYGVGSKKIITILEKIKIPWSINSLAEIAGVIAIDDKSHLKKSKLLIKKELSYLKKNISKINGFDCIDSSTNFILIKTKIDSTEIQKKLLKKDILIRDCKNFRNLDNHFIRIAVKSHKENMLLVKALEAIK